MIVNSAFRLELTGELYRKYIVPPVTLEKPGGPESFSDSDIWTIGTGHRVRCAIKIPSAIIRSFLTRRNSDVNSFKLQVRFSFRWSGRHLTGITVYRTHNTVAGLPNRYLSISAGIEPNSEPRSNKVAFSFWFPDMVVDGLWIFNYKVCTCWHVDMVVVAVVVKWHKWRRGRSSLSSFV